MDLGIKGKVSLVTGGSRGIGLHCALSLAKEGVDVAVCGRTEETLDNAVEEIKALGVNSMGVVADISGSSAIEPLHQHVVDGLGPVDILVNNVGGNISWGDIVGVTLEDLKRTFDLNLFGGFRLMQLVIPHMQQTRWGRIINIASIGGREHGGNISYMSAKAALIGATKHAALSQAQHGVLVNSVGVGGAISHPGGTWERFQKENIPEVVESSIQRRLPMGKFGRPEQVGDLVAFLASERASLITGACVLIDGGESKSLI